MYLRNVIISVGIAASAVAFADPLVFKSPNFASNGATRATGLAATGISSPDVIGDFEGISNGNISGIANIYPGLTITAASGGAIVTTSPGLMGGSNPIGLKAVALDEGPNVTLNFASPIHYFS